MRQSLVTAATPVRFLGVYVPLFVEAWLDDPVTGPLGKPINFVGFGVGNGFPACIPAAGRKIDWCVDLRNVGTFNYPNVRRISIILCFFFFILLLLSC